MYAALCDVVRRHPRHLVLAGGVVGLLAGPRAWAFAPAAAAGLACLAVAADGRVVMAVAVAGAVLGGALVAQGRLRALDRSRLLPLLGRKVELRGTLLEQPRTSPTGHAYALVEL
ncbi:MAG TPA: hypothetical protein VHE14_02760, partial [Solirubrobacteraceae bacterium]|nr:hypothetical protein [Solirubrobacteraceae bacterium]